MSLSIRAYAEEIKQFAGQGLGLYEMCSAIPAGQTTAPTTSQIQTNIANVIAAGGALFPLPNGLSPAQAAAALVALGPVLQAIAPAA